MHRRDPVQKKVQDGFFNWEAWKNNTQKFDSSTWRHEKNNIQNIYSHWQKNLRTEKQKNKTEFFLEVNLIAQYCHDIFAWAQKKKASAYTMLYIANHLENRNPIK